MYHRYLDRYITEGKREKERQLLRGLLFSTSDFIFINTETFKSNPKHVRDEGIE